MAPAPAATVRFRRSLRTIGRFHGTSQRSLRLRFVTCASSSWISFSRPFIGVRDTLLLMPFSGATQAKPGSRVHRF